MASVEGIFEPGDGFDVELACLGDVSPTRIGDVEVLIALPQCQPDGGEGRPTLRAPAFQHVRSDYDWATWYTEEDPGEVWGRVHRWTEDAGCEGEGAAWVGRLGVRIPEPANSSQHTADAVSLYAAVDEWWLRVREWVAVVGHQLHLSEFGRTHGVDRPGGGLQLWTASPNGNAGVDFVYNPGPIRAWGRSSGGLKVAEWRAILAKAAVGDSPPLMWRLLRSAEQMLAAGSTRRALIDAGTAAELALTGLLDRRLAKVDSDVREALLGSYQMLSRRARLFVRLGGRLPAAFQQDLIEPRNRATHEGSSPSPEVVRSAIRAAETVVQQAFPHSDLL
jgi:hypothetical protein